MSRVKPLDLSFIMRHAFLSGVVAARNIPAEDECEGTLLWLDYNPGKNPSLERIWKAIYPDIPMGGNPLEPMEISIDFAMVQALAEAAQKSEWVPIEYSMNEIVYDCCKFLREERADDKYHQLKDSVSKYQSLKKAYDEAPTDRGGQNGPKGKAFAEMNLAYDDMIVLIQPKKET